MPNPSGINPKEFKVVVEPKPVETKIGSIIIPDSKQESEKYATMEGRLIAVSRLAFTSYATAEEQGDDMPKVGEIVLFARYSGHRRVGKDGKEYLVMKDQDIFATIEE